MATNAYEESAVAAAERIERWKEAAECYADPFEFVAMGFDVLGYKVTEAHMAIVDAWMEGEPHIIIMAQREQSKTTVMGLLDGWSIVQNPHARITVFGGRAKLATSISSMIIKVLRKLPLLSCMMRTESGANESTTLFEVHPTLKGTDKTPNIQPISLRAGSQGERNDFAHCDDLETLTNSASSIGREKNKTLTEEISSQTKRRMWVLGTPQVKDSLYSYLESKGFKTYIIPGRFPTPEQRPMYGDRLARWVDAKIAQRPDLQTGGGADGTQGKPVCAEYLGEDVLQRRETAQSKSMYLLQTMLNTSMINMFQAPLTWSKVMLIHSSPQYPITIQPSAFKSEIVESLRQEYRFAVPADIPSPYAAPTMIITAIDPALGGKTDPDRTAIVTIAVMKGWVCIIGMRSVEGGYSEERINEIAKAVAQHRPDVIRVEKNAGYGMFTQILTPAIRRIDPATWLPEIKDEMSRGQKEPRIIDEVEPLFGAGAVAVTRAALKEHDDSLAGLPEEDQAKHSMLRQVENITREKNSLPHDDGADAFAMALAEARERGLIMLDSRALSDEEQRRMDFEATLAIVRGKLPAPNAFNHRRSR